MLQVLIGNSTAKKVANSSFLFVGLCISTRDATIYRYIAYRIILRQYRYIDTKSNRIDISRIVIYRHIMAC